MPESGSLSLRDALSITYGRLTKPEQRKRAGITFISNGKIGLSVPDRGPTDDLFEAAKNHNVTIFTGTRSSLGIDVWLTWEEIEKIQSDTLL